MKPRLYIVTGASKGLGFELAQFLSEKDDVVVLNRSEAAALNPKIEKVSIDLAKDFSAKDTFSEIFLKFPLKNYNRVTLVNNAGVVEPISPADKLLSQDVQRNFAINLYAPIALSSEFLSYAVTNGLEFMVASVSSGVARRPKSYWSIYSAAKAGLEAFSVAVQNEYTGPQVKLLTFDPSVMDTGMQETIRSANEEDCPDLAKFVEYKEKGMLRHPRVVAQALASLLSRDLGSLDKAHYTINELL